MAGTAPRKARKGQAGSPIVTQDAACKLPLEGMALRRPRCNGEQSTRPLEFGWYLPTHGDTTAYGVMEA